MCFQYTECAASCDKALEIEPTEPATWFLKSFALEMLGRFEEALESCDKGLEIDPENIVGWCNKGRYLYSLGQLESALQTFSTALNINPQSEYAREVEDKIKKWLQREGQNDEWIQKVLHFLQRGRHNEALDSYQSALDTSPRSIDESFSKDYALAHLQNPEKIMVEYEREKKAQEPEIHMELAQNQFQFGSWSWVEITFSNRGKGEAVNLTYDFPSEFKVKYLDVDPEAQLSGQHDLEQDLQRIPKLEGGDYKIRLVSLLPTRIGDYPLDVQISYADTWGTQHRTTKSLWVSVFRPGQQLPTISGHKMLWRLGTGRLADLYIAKRNRDGTTVAIKMPRFSPEQVVLVTDFLRHVKAWSKLNHPNIVMIYQYAEEHPYWFAMEYMEKGSLRKRIGSLSPTESLHIGIRLTEALVYAKRSAMTHRHIKPENVLFDNRDVPKLSDWRIRTVMRKALESADTFINALAYSAPERLSTDFGSADGRTDIYQLGVLLYEMLTGKTPFAGDEEELIERIKTEEPRRPSDLNFAVMKDLDPIVLKCLAKHKEERYQDASSLGKDLAKVLRSRK